MSKNTDSLQLLHFFSHCTARMAETSDSEEERFFLTQSSFNASSNRGNELEEATKGLCSFDHSADKHQEVSIGSVEKETRANKHQEVSIGSVEKETRANKHQEVSIGSVEKETRANKHHEVSIGSVEKETKANKKKALKRDIMSWMTKSCWPGTVKWKA